MYLELFSTAIFCDIFASIYLTVSLHFTSKIFSVNIQYKYWVRDYWNASGLLGLLPSAGPKDLIQIQGDGFCLNQTLNLLGEGRG